MKRQTLFYTLLISVAALLAVHPVRADDVVVGNGTPASCTEAALDAALAQLYPGPNFPGGVLTFNCGPTPHTILLSREKVLDYGTVVDGGGRITLSGSGITRIFAVEQEARVEIRNITLLDGAATAGGAIFAGGNWEPGYEFTSLLLDHVVVRNSQAISFGGGIATQRTHLSIRNSSIEENSALEGGGGGISFNTGTLSINNSLILANNAQSNGAGMEVWNASNFDISHTLIQSNSAASVNPRDPSDGGGIRLLNSHGIITATEILQNNSEEGRGGGVYSEDSDFTIHQSTIGHNRAIHGGGLSIDGGTITLQGVTLANNSAINDGGGIRAIASNQIYLTNTTFAQNQAQFSGGGIFTESSNVILTNVTISGNRAGNRGGGVYHRYGASALQNVTIVENHAATGGGIHFEAIPTHTPTPTSTTAPSPTPSPTPTPTQINNGRATDGQERWAQTTPTATPTSTSTAVVDSQRNARLVAQSTPQFTMKNTLLAGNTATNASDQCYVDDLFAAILYSLWPGSSCGNSTANGNQPNTAALVGPLAFSANRLPNEQTMTHALLPGSPALDTGTCADTPSTDQRGVARPQGSGCDIGAYERIVSPKTPQIIDFPAIPDKMVGDAPFTLKATASSALPIAFASTTPTICSVAGDTVTLLLVGNCSIVARQPGDATYAAADDVNRTFAINALERKVQIIQFVPPPTTAVGFASFTISITSTSGLPVRLRSNTLPICTVAEQTVTPVAIGTCIIQGDQEGDALHLPATPVLLTFQIVGTAQEMNKAVYLPLVQR